MTDWAIIRTVGARERVVADELRRGLGLHSYHPVERFKITRAARTIEHNPTRTDSSLRRGILHNAHPQPDGSWQWRYDRGSHARSRQTARSRRSRRSRCR